MQLQVLLSLGIDVHEEKCGNMESNEATIGGVESVHSIQFHVIITIHALVRGSRRSQIIGSQIIGCI